jgi:hypothetical protein
LQHELLAPFGIAVIQMCCARRAELLKQRTAFRRVTKRFANAGFDIRS